MSTLQNGCVGSGCTQVQESYFYNTRMQMAVAELGTSSNHAADSCRVYNYYVGANNVSACSESPSNWPTGGNNNGDVAGYYYNDSVNTGLSHKATYNYDSLNRLASAAATGNTTYSQTFSYDQYGNMDCSASPAETQCVALTYSASTNRITTSGYTYDAAGNLTGDGTNTYQWDAEAHLTKVLNGQSVTISTNTYNALGQRVRDVTHDQHHRRGLRRGRQPAVAVHGQFQRPQSARLCALWRRQPGRVLLQRHAQHHLRPPR